MKVRLNILLLACVAVAFALFALFALETDVTGKWEAVCDEDFVLQKYVFEFKVEGEKLTGKVSCEDGRSKREAPEHSRHGPAIEVICHCVSLPFLLEFTGSNRRPACRLPRS